MIQIDEVLQVFDKQSNQRYPYEDLGTILRWLGFNPTNRELDKYKDTYKSTDGCLSEEAIKTILEKKFFEPDTRHELEEAMKLIGGGSDKIPVPEMRWILTQLGDKMREDEADELIKELAEDNFIDLAKIRELSFPSEDEPKKKKTKDAKGKGKGKTGKK